MGDNGDTSNSAEPSPRSPEGSGDGAIVKGKPFHPGVPFQKGNTLHKLRGKPVSKRVYEYLFKRMDPHNKESPRRIGPLLNALYVSAVGVCELVRIVDANGKERAIPGPNYVSPNIKAAQTLLGYVQAMPQHIDLGLPEGADLNIIFQRVVDAGGGQFVEVQSGNDNGQIIDVEARALENNQENRDAPEADKGQDAA